MNANINYDEIPDTSAVQEDLLAALSGQHVTVHTSEEPDYDRMKQDIAALLAGNAGVLSLYAEDHWLGSALCPEKVSADADVEKLLERCWQKQEPKEKLLAQGGRVELLYWDPAENKSFAIPAKA